MPIDQLLCRCGLGQRCVDMLDITGGFYGYIMPGNNRPGYFSTISKAIKEVVSIPVIVAGGITEIETAEKILCEGDADLIGVARAIYRDSNWAKNTMEKSIYKLI